MERQLGNWTRQQSFARRAECGVMYNTKTKWKILWLLMGSTKTERESNTLSGPVISVVWLFVFTCTQLCTVFR